MAESQRSAWIFPPESGGGFEGFNDAGIETFAGRPYSSLAREVIQNSLDAPAGNPGGPIRVFFDLIDIPREEFPDLGGLLKTMTAAARQAKELDDEEALQFFEHAIVLLGRESIATLRIADSNTAGLRGPCELGTPYFAFMKATGQSVKSSRTAGGSFGIGKNAPFALSDLRTIFVSTVYPEDDDKLELAQGKAILMSHKNSDQQMTRARGYFGSHDCQPIPTLSEAPGWLRRSTQFSNSEALQGTTVFVAGFRSQQNWQGLLISSIVSNYFRAIHAGRLEVVIDDGRHAVSMSTLEKWFNADIVLDAAEAEDTTDQLRLAEEMARCSTEQATVQESFQLERLGEVRVRLIVQEGLSKKVGVLRNGMLVTDRLKRLIQFPGYSDFIAVVECLDDTGNALLRAMENPEHNDFEPERLRRPEDVKSARRELSKLAEFVRNTLKEHAQVDRGEVTELDELAEFFQDPDEEVPSAADPTTETDIEGQMVLLPRPRKASSVAMASDEDASSSEAGGGGGVGGAGGGTEGEGAGVGKGVGGSGRRGLRNVELQDVRSIVVSPAERVLYFTPLETATARISIEDAGADAAYPLQIKKVTSESGMVEAGKVAGVRLRAKERVDLKVVLSHPFHGSIRVVANEV